MRDRKGQPVKLKIGVKYCGGCRSEYDRVGLVNELGRDLGEDVEMMRVDDDDADLILVVCGCKTACADTSSLPDKPKKYITSRNDAYRVMKELKKIRDNQK